MDKSFKLSAQKVAEESGFSSLQDLVRFLLTQFTEKKFAVTITSREPDEILTSAQEKVLMKKYKEARKDIANGKGTTVSSVDDMMKYLRS